VQDEEGRRDAVAGSVSVNSDPTHAASDFGSDGNDDGAGEFAAKRLRRDGYGAVGGIFKGEAGERGHGAVGGAEVADDEEGSGVRHAVEESVLVVEGDRELSGGAGRDIGCG